MLNPHACHHVVKKEIFKGNTRKLLQINYWCEDCQMRCWHDGSDVGYYFDFKDRQNYNVFACLNLLFRIGVIKPAKKKYTKTYKVYLKKYLKSIGKKKWVFPD